MRAASVRLWAEVAAAVAAAVLAVVASITPDWIERLTGAEPDARHGELEWQLVAVLAVVAVGFGLLAGRDWRRTPALSD